MLSTRGLVRNSWVLIAVVVVQANAFRVLADCLETSREPMKGVQAAAHCDNAEQPFTELGERLPENKPLAADQLTQRVYHPGARYLRLLFEQQVATTQRWYVTVRDDKLHVVEVLTNETFSRSKRHWTARIPGSISNIELRADPGQRVAAQLSIAEYIWMPDKSAELISYYSLQGRSPTFRPLYDAASKDQQDEIPFGDSVGMVLVSEGQASWCCSGVMVSQDLFFTNWHCGGHAPMGTEGYWSDDVCEDTLVDLSWDDGKSKDAELPTPSRERSCEKVVAKDRDLDFALLRVSPTSGDSYVQPVTIRQKPPLDGESLVVVHHPGCLPKRVSDGESCQVVSASYPGWRNRQKETEFTHRCDTYGGSSGAPVFDVDGRLVGLHHQGFERDPARSCQATDHENKAVRIRDIVDYLGHQCPAVLKELNIE